MVEGKRCRGRYIQRCVLAIQLMPDVNCRCYINFKTEPIVGLLQTNLQIDYLDEDHHVFAFFLTLCSVMEIQFSDENKDEQRNSAHLWSIWVGDLTKKHLLLAVMCSIIYICLWNPRKTGALSIAFSHWTVPELLSWWSQGWSPSTSWTHTHKLKLKSFEIIIGSIVTFINTTCGTEMNLSTNGLCQERIQRRILEKITIKLNTFLTILKWCFRIF